MKSGPSGSNRNDARLPDRPDPGVNVPQIPPRWKFAFWYVPIIFILLWLGMGAFVRINVRRIPYSEFKAHVDRREVVECLIKEDTIEGRIRTRGTNAAPQTAEAK